MKHAIQSLSVTFLTIILAVNSYAQAPNLINYQAIARDASGVPLISTPINVDFDILQSSPLGVLVYRESHNTSTNQFGLFNLQIGGGTPTFGTFAGINWSTGLYYLRVTINNDTMPATQLLSVPYALHANTATSGTPGANGHNSLTNITVEPSGANCANGGYLVEVGVDDNDDQILQALEIDLSYYVCNGIDGAANNSDTSATNEIQTLSISNDTVFLSNGGFVILPPASGDNDWVVNGTDMYADPSITGNVGIGTNTPLRKLHLESNFNGGDGVLINNNNPSGNVGLELQTQGTSRFVLGVDQTDNNKFKIAPTNAFTNTRFTITPLGNVGIGTINPTSKLSAISNDTIIANFVGSNPGGAAISVIGTNPSASVGALFLNGSDSGVVALDPSTKTLFLSNPTTNGHVAVSADSSTALYGQLIGNFANSIVNQADTIFSISNVGNNIIHVNNGTFITDSLYKLGTNSGNANWVLANDGFGQAVWTDPTTLPSSGASLWQSNTPDIFFNTGNVGIGTSFPQTTLHVLSNDTTGIITEGNNAFGTFNFTQNNNNGSVGELYISGTDTVFHSLEPLKSTYFINYKGNKKIQIESDTVMFVTNNKIMTYNKGNLFNDDTLYTNDLYVLNNSSNVGDVLTNIGGGRAVWQAPFGGTSPWTQTGTNIYPNTLTDFVGIGTSSPLAPLEISYTNSTGPSPALIIGNSVATGESNINFNFAGLREAKISKVGNNGFFIGTTNTNNFNLVTNNTNRLFIGGATGFVGIGTTGPSSELQVVGKTTTDNLQVLAGAGTAGQVLTSDAAGNATWQTPAGGAGWLLAGNSGTNSLIDAIGTLDAQDLVFKTNGVERLRMTAAGRIGIGITTPISPFNLIYSGSDQEGMLINYTNITPTSNGMGLFVAADNTGTAPIEAGSFQVQNSSNASKTIAVKANNIATSVNNIGIESIVSGSGTGTNLAGYFEAYGATTNYALQIVDGTEGAGNILTSDAAGNATWKLNQIAFEAHPVNSGQMISAGDWVSFDDVLLNDGGAYLNSSFPTQFVAPVTGVYLIHANVHYFAQGSGHFTMQLQVDNGSMTIVNEAQEYTVVNQYSTLNLTSTLRLNAGDKLSIFMFSDGSPLQITSIPGTSFSGHLIYAY